MTALLVSILLTSFVSMEKIVAVVGDNPILHSDIEEVMIQAGLNHSGSYEVDSETPEYLEALEILVENQLVVNAGIASGFYPTDEETQLLVEGELESNQVGINVDLEHLSETLADDHAAQMFLGRKVQTSLQNMPANSETYLVSNAELVEEIIMPRHISWIYLPILPSGPDFDVFMDEMIQLRARIASGESFEELAMEYSDDGSAMNGGYLGTFGLGEMTLAFEDAAFALEEGEISEPVVTTFGIHIIRLDGKNEDGTIEASHILRIVSIDGDDIDRTVANADTLLNDIRSSQLSFEDAARQYSRDRSSSENGGDMGMVPLKLWLQQIADVVEDLDIGTCSEPVVLENTGSVVLVKLLEDTGEIEWDSYTDSELDGLVQQVIYQDTYNSVIDSLRSEIPVIYYLENTI
ncbi:MAG: peptidylprolyl isomerase [Candidatus Aegiribacteria sp.]|nr:peptidylprolyl isomerase [Candidatus Aegiribacteria sp.]